MTPAEQSALEAGKWCKEKYCIKLDGHEGMHLAAWSKAAEADELKAFSKRVWQQVEDQAKEIGRLREENARQVEELRRVYALVDHWSSEARKFRAEVSVLREDRALMLEALSAERAIQIAQRCEVARWTMSAAALRAYAQYAARAKERGDV